MVESIFDRFPLPPAAKLLGWHVRAFDKEAQTIEVGYLLDDRFLNPAGDVQGGFIAAMLDDTAGPALFCSTDGAFYAPTIELHVSFIRPAKPGQFVGRGRVVSLGRTIVFLEGELFDAQNNLIARATASGRVMSGGKVT
ncbi:MAG: PaaI family thioesterase [Proteobacteria bacterium]|nr:PaaI family thioesterase [Pseudomonadota bacterium]